MGPGLGTIGHPSFLERVSLLKNPPTHSSVPGSGAEYAGSVAFRPRFPALLDPDRAYTPFFNSLNPSTHSDE